MPQLGLHVELCVIGVVTCVNAVRNTCCDRAVSHLMCIITSWHAMWISVWRGFYFPEAKFGCSKIKNVSIGNDWMFCFFFRTAFCFGNDLFIWSRDSICRAYLPHQIFSSLCAADLSISGKNTNNLSSSVSPLGLQQRWDAHSRQSMFILSSSSLVRGLQRSVSIFLSGVPDEQRVSDIDPSQIFKRCSCAAASSRGDGSRRRCRRSWASWRVSDCLLWLPLSSPLVILKVLFLTFGDRWPFETENHI